MPRALIALLFVASVVAGLFFIAIEPPTVLIAQTPTEPEYPLCTDGLEPILQFGPGELRRPSNLEASYSFPAPLGVEPVGEVLVWQGEGHHWDQGCNIGPDNDDGLPCDQQQLLEIITFTVNSAAIGQFIDHSPDTDNNYLYTFTVNSLVAGNNVLGLHHLNEGVGANSAFYKGVVCANLQNAATATPTSTDTSTPTLTPTATDTSTPLPTNTATSTPTNTPTNTATSTPTNTPDGVTGTPTPTTTSTPSPTVTATPVVTETVVATGTPIVIETSTPTNTPVITPTYTPTVTPTPLPTDETDPTNLDPGQQPPAPNQPGQPCSANNCQYLPLMRN